MRTAGIPFTYRVHTAIALTVLAAASWAAAQNRDQSGSAANVPSSGVPGKGSPGNSIPGNTAPSAPSGALPAAGPGAKAAERLREGTKLIDVVGTFQSIGGENITFTPNSQGGSKDSFRVLENLALQRVSQELEGNKGARQWTVTADVTEYKGNNYLLLKKIVVHPQEGDTAASQ